MLQYFNYKKIRDFLEQLRINQLQDKIGVNTQEGIRTHDLIHAIHCKPKDISVYLKTLLNFYIVFTIH
jgi:hypothetical protein